MQQGFETFTALMTTIHRSIRKIKAEEIQPFHLKPPHISCLYYLYQQPFMTAKELCSHCKEDKANMSRTIEYLAGNGYIVCRTQPKKRYRSRWELTEKGTEVGKQIAEKVDAMLLAAGQGLDDEHKRIMYESLIQINHNLQLLCNAYTQA